MKFEYISSDRVKVSLSANDIAAAGLDIESSDEKDIRKLKKYLMLLLSKIKLPSDSLGTYGDTLYIEIYPQSSGGAIVYFIIDCGVQAPYQPAVFCFYSINDLIKAAIALFCCYSHRLYKSALYQYGDCWLFIICPLDGTLSPTVSLLSEYGEQIEGGWMTASFIEEHSKPIIRERAADMLAFYFG